MMLTIIIIEFNTLIFDIKITSNVGQRKKLGFSVLIFLLLFFRRSTYFNFVHSFNNKEPNKNDNIGSRCTIFIIIFIIRYCHYCLLLLCWLLLLLLLVIVVVTVGCTVRLYLLLLLQLVVLLDCSPGL